MKNSESEKIKEKIIKKLNKIGSLWFL